MSGGSLNYAYSAVETAAREIEQRAYTSQHKAFASHLFKVADALHDIEWLFSGDYSEGAEVAAINACISKAQILESATRDAERAARELETALSQARGNNE